MNLTSPWKYVITRVPLCVNSSRFSVNKPWEKNHWIPFYSTFTAVTLLQFKHYQNHRRRKMGIVNWAYFSNLLKEIFSLTQWVETVWNKRFHFINKNFFPMNSVVSKWASEWVSGVRQQVTEKDGKNHLETERYGAISQQVLGLFWTIVFSKDFPWLA